MSRPTRTLRGAPQSKRELRSLALERRRAIASEELEALSSRVAARLFETKEFARARLVISYCAKRDEVQTRGIIERLLREGRRVAVVVTDPTTRSLRFSEVTSFEEDLATGTFGILEPKPGHLRLVSLGEAQVVLVPLVAWDTTGQRLGYGAGYFDRALSGASKVTKIGLALESQRLARIPGSHHDVPLDLIVTERRTVRPSAMSGAKTLVAKKAFKNSTRQSGKRENG